MDWHRVSDSSVIAAEAYDADSKTIYLRFKNGAEWWYSDCPPQEWEAFRSGSRGRYLNTVLKSKPSGQVAG